MSHPTQPPPVDWRPYPRHQPYGPPPPADRQPYPRQQYGPPPSTPPTPKPRVWPWLVGGLVALLVIGGAGSGGDSGGDNGGDSPSPAPGTAAAVPVAEPTGPLTTFGNGTWVVGADVAPGRYRSPAPEEGIMQLCYWDITDGQGTILDQAVANEGPSRATLQTGRTFTSQGCQDWVSVG